MQGFGVQMGMYQVGLCGLFFALGLAGLDLKRFFELQKRVAADAVGGAFRGRVDVRGLECAAMDELDDEPLAHTEALCCDCGCDVAATHSRLFCVSLMSAALRRRKSSKDSRRGF